jgi:CheY-like chemotaxis protein
MPLDLRMMDLAGAFKVATASARVLAEKKTLQIETVFPTSTYEVFADPHRLAQVFWNLFDNAIKFTPPGGKIFVKLNTINSANGKFARVQITDSGIGIRPEFLPHIFKRFSQEDSALTRVHNGLGLGLAIVKSLVEMQKGVVSVESKGDGKGSTFILDFPLVREKVESDPIPTPPAEPIRLDGLRILVVDDSPENRVLFSALLKSLGAVVYLADSASAGLQALKELKPDILLSDISMPGEDGYS